MGAPHAHWIKPTVKTNIPKCWVFVGLETIDETENLKTTETFSGAYVIADCPSHNWRGEPRRHETAVHTPSELWSLIDDLAGVQHRCILVTYDLPALIQTSMTLPELGKLGWYPHRLNLEASAAGSQWRNDRRRLVMVDLVTWLPKGFAATAAHSGASLTHCSVHGTYFGPRYFGAADRCRVAAGAWSQLMGWLEVNDMGDWRSTGASMGFQVWRKNHLTHRVLVHDNEDIRRLERQSCYAGRAEAYRVGKQKDLPLYDWDRELAYAAIGRDEALPVRMVGEITGPPVERLGRVPAGRAWLCQAEVATQSPVLPWQDEHGVCWPVGTFRGVWWHRELLAAIAEGAEVRISRAVTYQLAPALASWGRWIAAAVTGDVAGSTPLTQMLAKHWARAVIGKFGAQYTNYERSMWEDPGDVYRMERFKDLDGIWKNHLLLGPKWYIETGKIEASDSVISIMSYVMMLCRLELWHAMSYVGFDHVVHCDTDGFICDRVGHGRMLESGINGWRLKGEWRRLDVIASRLLSGDLDRRLPGVPRAAQEIRDRVYTGSVRRTLIAAMARQERGELLSVNRTFVPKGRDLRRRRLATGYTAPIPVIDNVRCEPVTEMRNRRSKRTAKANRKAG